jgi:PPOX class probable FMN-dependent enzyme
MPQTFWRASLVLALYRNRHAAQSRYLQLATVRANGRPANRTVVFRGFLNETPEITMVTDARSAKIHDLDGCPWAEACWYFPISQEQFRLGGRVTVVRDGGEDKVLREARLNAWRDLSESTRQSFAWPTPGALRDPNARFLGEPPDRESPLPSFCLLVLNPLELEHLELDGNPQNRWIYRRDDHGQWSGHEVNP